VAVPEVFQAVPGMEGSAMNPKIFPTLLIFLNLCASACWAYNGNWRQTVYWLAAATLNFVITY